MKIGIDVDGVLADFNEAFVRRVIGVTGRNLFPEWPFEIPTWNYPEHYGYTGEEVSKVWAAIRADGLFWFSLLPYPDTYVALEHLKRRVVKHHDDLYFITARPGIDAKGQTEEWLRARFPGRMSFHPTVLITAAKGWAAKVLELDVYVDDRWENCLDVNAIMGHRTRVCLLDQPWNQMKVEGREDAAPLYGISRVSSVVAAFDR